MAEGGPVPAEKRAETYKMGPGLFVPTPSGWHNLDLCISTCQPCAVRSSRIAHFPLSGSPFLSPYHYRLATLASPRSASLSPTSQVRSGDLSNTHTHPFLPIAAGAVPIRVAKQKTRSSGSHQGINNTSFRSPSRAKSRKGNSTPS